MNKQQSSKIADRINPIINNSNQYARTQSQNSPSFSGQVLDKYSRSGQVKSLQILPIKNKQKPKQLEPIREQRESDMKASYQKPLQPKQTGQYSYQSLSLQSESRRRLKTSKVKNFNITPYAITNAREQEFKSFCDFFQCCCCANKIVYNLQDNKGWGCP